MNSILNSVFTGNTAVQKGGAIYYNRERPILSQNIFAGNVAAYGPDIASYPVKIVLKGTGNNQIYIYNAVSGQKHSDIIELELIDFDNQILVLENSETVKIQSFLSNSSISGNDYAKFTNGLAVLDDIEFIAKPGSESVIYNLTSNALDFDTISAGIMNFEDSASDYINNILATFRYCEPGEIEVDQIECRVCDYGSYSLDWNSTQ